MSPLNGMPVSIHIILLTPDLGENHAKLPTRKVSRFNSYLVCWKKVISYLQTCIKFCDKTYASL